MHNGEGGHGDGPAREPNHNLKAPWGRCRGGRWPQGHERRRGGVTGDGSVLQHKGSCEHAVVAQQDEEGALTLVKCMSSSTPTSRMP